MFILNFFYFFIFFLIFFSFFISFILSLLLVSLNFFPSLFILLSLFFNFNPSCWGHSLLFLFLALSYFPSLSPGPCVFPKFPIVGDTFPVLFNSFLLSLISCPIFFLSFFFILSCLAAFSSCSYSKSVYSTSRIFSSIPSASPSPLSSWSLFSIALSYSAPPSSPGKY